VRDKATYWVDYSRPGDRPVYAWDRQEHGMTPAEKLLASALESIAAKARSFTAESATVPKTTAQAASSGSNHAHAKVPDDSDDEREEDTGDAARSHAGDAGLPSAPAAAAFSDAGTSRR
jgi:hypothetical protein